MEEADKVRRVFEIAQKFSHEQKQCLLEIADFCKEDGSLAPLFALLFISTEPLTEAEMAQARAMAEEIILLDKSDAKT